MYAICQETKTFSGGISFNFKGFNEQITIEKGKVYSIIARKYVMGRGITCYYINVQGIIVQISSNGRAKHFKIVETLKIWTKIQRLIYTLKLNAD